MSEELTEHAGDHTPGNTEEAGGPASAAADIVAIGSNSPPVEDETVDPVADDQDSEQLIAVLGSTETFTQHASDLDPSEVAELAQPADGSIVKELKNFTKPIIKKGVLIGAKMLGDTKLI